MICKCTEPSWFWLRKRSNVWSEQSGTVLSEGKLRRQAQPLKSLKKYQGSQIRNCKRCHWSVMELQERTSRNVGTRKGSFLCQLNHQSAFWPAEDGGKPGANWTMDNKLSSVFKEQAKQEPIYRKEELSNLIWWKPNVGWVGNKQKERERESRESIWALSHVMSKILYGYVWQSFFLLGPLSWERG